MQSISTFITEQQEASTLQNTAIMNVIDIVSGYLKLYHLWDEVRTKPYSPQGVKLGEILTNLENTASQLLSTYDLNMSDTDVEIYVDVDEIKTKKLVTVIRRQDEWKELRKLLPKFIDEMKVQSTNLIRFALLSLLLLGLEDFLRHVE